MIKIIIKNCYIQKIIMKITLNKLIIIDFIKTDFKIVIKYQKEKFTNRNKIV